MSQITKCYKVTVGLSYWEASGEVSELSYKSLLFISSKRSYCSSLCASVPLCMHHLLTPSHLQRLLPISFPPGWHFQYPTAKIDKEDPQAGDRPGKIARCLIFLTWRTVKMTSLNWDELSPSVSSSRHRPPALPNLSESRSTNGITDCQESNNFPTKFRRNLEISWIWEKKEG